MGGKHENIGSWARYGYEDGLERRSKRPRGLLHNSTEENLSHELYVFSQEGVSELA